MPLGDGLAVSIDSSLIFPSLSAHVCLSLSLHTTSSLILFFLYENEMRSQFSVPTAKSCFLLYDKIWLYEAINQNKHFSSGFFCCRKVTITKNQQQMQSFCSFQKFQSGARPGLFYQQLGQRSLVVYWPQLLSESRATFCSHSNKFVEAKSVSNRLISLSEKISRQYNIESVIQLLLITLMQIYSERKQEMFHLKK